jgi:hypothetical protein
MITKNTLNGQIISYGPVTPEMEAAADECFLAYKALDEKMEKFNATIPEGFSVKNFYGKGDCVIIDRKEELEAQAKWQEENS